MGDGQLAHRLRGDVVQRADDAVDVALGVAQGGDAGLHEPPHAVAVVQADGKAAARAERGEGGHMAVDDVQIVGVEQGDEIVDGLKAAPRIAEQAFDVFGDREAAVDVAFPDEVGDDGEERRGGVVAGNVAKSAHDVAGDAVGVAQALGVQLHGDPVTVHAAGADVAGKGVVGAGAERVEIGFQPVEVLRMGEDADFISGKATVGDRETGVAGKDGLGVAYRFLLPDDLGNGLSDDFIQI